MTEESVVAHRVRILEEAIQDIRGSLKGINESLTTLTRLEERHRESKDAIARAFQRIEQGEKDLAEFGRRIAAVELALPVLKLTSHWVKAGVGGILALVGAAVWKLVVGG